MVVLRNCEESESDKAIEYSEESNCFYFPPSPTYFPPSPTTFPPSPSYFPLYSPLSPPRPFSSNSSVTYVWDAVIILLAQNELGEEIVDLPDFHLALVVEYKIQDRGGALDVIPSGRLVKINELVDRLDDIVDCQRKNIVEFVDELVKPLEKQNEDIIDQLVIDTVAVRQFLFQYRDGALDDIQLVTVSRMNGSEISDGQLLTSTPEPALIFQTKLSLRLWLGHRGQWVVDICYGWNWLNTGTLKTAEGSLFSSGWVSRFRGGKDLFDYPFSELFVNENRAEPTTKPRTEIQMLELSPTEEQENPNEDFEFWCSEAMGNDGVEAEATRNDGVEAVGIRSCNGCDSTPIQARQENLGEDLGNDEVDDAGIGGEGTKEGEIDEAQFNSGAFGKRKKKEKTPRGERGNKKTTPVRNVIPLEKILQVKKMRLTDAADHLKVSPSALKRACRENCIKRWPPRDIHETPAVVVEEESAPLTSDTLLSDQALMAAIDINSVAEETTPQQFLPIVRQDNPDKDSSNDKVDEVGMGGVGTGEVEMRKNEKASGGERGGVRIKNPLEVLLRYSPMCIEDAAMELKVDEELEMATAEYLIIWNSPSPPLSFAPSSISRVPYNGSGESPMDKLLEKRQQRPANSGDQSDMAAEENFDVTSLLDFPPSPPPRSPSPANLMDNPLQNQQHHPLTPAAPPISRNNPYAGISHSVAKETTPQQFSPIVRQDKPDKDSSNDKVDEVAMGGVRTGEVEMRTNEKASGGERGGVRIKIPLEEILTYSHMRIKDAAMELKVSRSTLKRICRDYNISRWPPRDEHKRIGQSHPNESPAIVDQERIPPLKSNMPLPANQVSASIDNTHSVTVRANYEDIRIKFRLSLPWRMVELEQEVKKRLQLDAGTYYIKYKDEDDGLTLIACNEDLKDCISSSSPLGTHSIEVFLSQKVAHEVRVDQL